MIRRRRGKKEIENVNAILCSDLHIRADVPLCRTDDFLQAQENKLKFIFDLCRHHQCPLLIGGDIGHRAQWPNWLLEKFISLAHDVEIFACLGQHDLPSHSLEMIPKSAVGVLSSAGVININMMVGISMFHYGQEIQESRNNIAISHQMVIQGKEEWPGQVASKGKDLLKKHPCYKLILTGDNHQPFTCEHEGRILVNPGSMMRTTAGQIDHKPRVYIWDEKQNIVEPVYLPIEKGVVDRFHIEVSKEKDERIDAFIQRVKTDCNFDFSFTDNLKKYFDQNRTKKSVKEKILEICG